jgi:hypothetical protein
MRDKTMKNNKKIFTSKEYIVISAIVFLLIGVGFFVLDKPKNNLQKKSIATENEPSAFDELKYSEASQKFAAQLLKKPIGKKKSDAADLKYLNTLMKDPLIQHFFNYTVDFFDRGPAAYSAARFVTLTMRMDSSTPEHIQAMIWTQAEIKKNSKEIYQKLVEKKDKIDDNLYFYNRALNLVHQINVTPEEKARVFSQTIIRPLEIDDSGKLSDQSDVTEVALILMRQSISDPAAVAPIIYRALGANKTAEQKNALKLRVLNHYPALSYMF